MNKPQYINWSKKFSIGNENVDNDHKKLFEIHNDLVDLVSENCSRKEFARILSEMTDYVLNHFKKEEAYMRELNFPDYDEHRKRHDEYSYQVAMYNYQLSGPNPPEPIKIIAFIKNWWTNHIVTFDMEYENFKNQTKAKAKYSSF